MDSQAKAGLTFLAAAALVALAFAGLGLAGPGDDGSNAAPVADFTATWNGSRVTFHDASADRDGTVVSWSWDFGDGGTSTVQDPIHVYAGLGSYAVTLAVRDDDGASHATSKTLTVPCKGKGPCSLGPTIPGPLRFGAPTALPQNSVHGAEPNIAVLPDGTIFVAAMSGWAWKPGAVEGNAWLWRSQDDGASWERLRGPFPDELGDEPWPGTNPPGFCSCDPDVVTSPDGWVYYTDWWTTTLLLTSGPGNFIVERSPDGGETWFPTPITVPATGSNSDPFFMDRQWLLAGEDGFVALFYHQADAVVFGVTGDGATLKMVASYNHGLTWGLPVTVLEGTGAFWDIAAHPRMLPDGTILIPVVGITEFQEGKPLTEVPTILRVLRSADQGATWDQKDILELPGGVGAFFAQSAAADDEGNLLIAFNERLEDGTHLFTIESRDGGETWSAPEPLATSGFDAVPWVTGRDDGRFAVAWYSSNWTGEEADAPDGTEWFAMAAERTTADGEWRHAKVDEVPVWTGPMCFDGAGCGDRPLRDYLSLDYGPDGGLHVAYTRGYFGNFFDLFHPGYGKVHYAQAEPTN